MPVDEKTVSGPFNKTAEGCSPQEDLFGPVAASQVIQTCSFDQIVSESFNKSQFLILGDTHHDLLKFEFLARDDVMKSFSGNGVKHIHLEAPNSLSFLLDEYYNNEIDKNYFLSEMSKRIAVYVNGISPGDMSEKIADTVEKAKINGIRVHFSDYSFASNQIDVFLRLSQPEYADIRKKTFQVAAEYNPETDRARFNKRLDEVLTYEEKRRIKLEFHKLRFDDSRTAQQIAAVSGGEKSVVLWGANHISFFNPHGLDDILKSSGGAATIALHSTYKDLSSFPAMNRETSSLLAYPLQMFSYHYIIENGFGFQGDPQNRVSEIPENEAVYPVTQHPPGWERR